ncbi:BREX-1 system adenine-specific DNA-methyltransferase PglX [Azospirillum argentinense]
MNRNKLKTYAPKARRAFIQAVTARASKFGINASKIEPVQVQGDVALIDGQAFPRKVAEQRRKLEERITLRGFEQVIEEAAYTWFNRFAAIRFMEVHGYLDHGYRVLSHPEGKRTPEIIEHAEHIDLPGLDREKVINLKLDGTKDEELYRVLLTAQCNALHTAMPFLFERIDDETELLLPDNLLHSDSLIRQMVSQIDEADWQEIEIIGWLYQFYISEKKDDVIGKVVKSDDIPAATQLFTPNWIVKYMVQNSLGAKWLATYPKSTIRSKMEYYIEQAEQTDEVKDKIANITPEKLNPEDLTLLDPACGSGHILIEAYNLFREIYLECGYSLREIPKLILEKNLFGLDIDDRAAQLACFSLLMRARRDDRRILCNTPSLNVVAIQTSHGLNASDVDDVLQPVGAYELIPGNDLFEETVSQPYLKTKNNKSAELEEIIQLINIFRDAKNIGSILEIEPIKTDFNGLTQALSSHMSTEDLLGRVGASHFASAIKALVHQYSIMSSKYDAVVANPPYMGRNYFNKELKEYTKIFYKRSNADLYGCFIEKGVSLLKAGGYLSMITIPNWMSSVSFEGLRQKVFDQLSIRSFIYNGRGVFGSDFGSCAFTIANFHDLNWVGTYKKLFSRRGSVSTNETLAKSFFSSAPHNVSTREQIQVPGYVFAFWFKKSVFSIFEKQQLLGSSTDVVVGLQTGDNPRFIRYWHEVSFDSIGFANRNRDQATSSGMEWFPYTKGGDFRKWYGNNYFVVNWKDDGREIRRHKSAVIRNSNYYFKEGCSYTNISISYFAARYTPAGFIFDQKGSMFFAKKDEDLVVVLGFLNSKVADYFFDAFCPTMDFNPGSIVKLPYIAVKDDGAIRSSVKRLVDVAKKDWDSEEHSWDYERHPLLNGRTAKTLKDACIERELHANKMAEEAEEHERVINVAFATTYDLESNLDLSVQDVDITLKKPDRAQDMVGLLSYVVGLIMGRYSLAEPGLIFAKSGNAGFDASRYGDFPADDDGIVPITEAEWFSDDAANRFTEFLKIVWSPEMLKENLKFVADNLGAKTNETPIDTIRRYLSREFYKDHLKAYKKRPIYWLFSSGKEKSFECLVYLHRYNEGTLSRMRMEYVTPLQGRVSARIEQLDRDIQAASTTAAQNKLRKEQEKLKKQQAELIKFDEELRHYADKRIKLDLDDGVKVNYGKFGNLLAEVKTVTGGSDE